MYRGCFNEADVSAITFSTCFYVHSTECQIHRSDTLNLGRLLFLRLIHSFVCTPPQSKSQSDNDATGNYTTGWGSISGWLIAIILLSL